MTLSSAKKDQEKKPDTRDQFHLILDFVRQTINYHPCMSRKQSISGTETDSTAVSPGSKTKISACGKQWMVGKRNMSAHAFAITRSSTPQSWSSAIKHISPSYLYFLTHRLTTENLSSLERSVETRPTTAPDCRSPKSINACLAPSWR